MASISEYLTELLWQKVQEDSPSQVGGGNGLRGNLYFQRLLPLSVWQHDPRMQLRVRRNYLTVSMRQNLFLTGPKHIGKSTILFSTLLEFPMTVGGFRVDRVFEGRRLRAFRIIDLATSSAADISTARKGGWDIHLEAFETVGAEAVRRGIRCADLVVMDELGRFELRAYGFRQAVTDALDSPVPVIGVLKEDDNPFLNEIRSREDTEILEVTEENRDDAKQHVEDWLSRVLAQE